MGRVALQLQIEVSAFSFCKTPPDLYREGAILKQSGDAVRSASVKVCFLWNFSPCENRHLLFQCLEGGIW